MLIPLQIITPLIRFVSRSTVNSKKHLSLVDAWPFVGIPEANRDSSESTILFLSLCQFEHPLHPSNLWIRWRMVRDSIKLGRTEISSYEQIRRYMKRIVMPWAISTKKMFLIDLSVICGSLKVSSLKRPSFRSVVILDCSSTICHNSGHMHATNNTTSFKFS